MCRLSFGLVALSGPELAGNGSEHNVNDHDKVRLQISLEERRLGWDNLGYQLALIRHTGLELSAVGSIQNMNFSWFGHIRTHLFEKRDAAFQRVCKDFR